MKLEVFNSVSPVEKIANLKLIRETSHSVVVALVDSLGNIIQNGRLIRFEVNKEGLLTFRRKQKVNEEYVNTNSCKCIFEATEEGQ